MAGRLGPKRPKLVARDSITVNREHVSGITGRHRALQFACRYTVALGAFRDRNYELHYELTAEVIARVYVAFL